MNKKAFTFVELIVSMVIIIILAGIGFVSYSSSIVDARDSQRKSDLAQYGSALKIYKQKRGYFPDPGEAFNIVYSGSIVSKQGLFNTDVKITTLDKLSYDPKINKPYIYSVTKNKQEYEITASLENEGKPKALVTGSYKTVSKNILPSILLAINANSGDNIEIKDGIGDGTINKNKFIFNNQYHNLAYSFIPPSYGPLSDGTSMTGTIVELEAIGEFWQNSDYRNCLEIEEAGKLIIDLDSNPFEYQILSSTGTLTNTGCTQ